MKGLNKEGIGQRFFYIYNQDDVFLTNIIFRKV